LPTFNSLKVDVIVTTALIPGKQAPILIDTETVHMMKPNSVIVDMAAEMGGNCELTRKGERHVDPKSHVIILGYTDLPSRMSQQAAELFGTNMYNLFEELCSIPRVSSILKTYFISNISQIANNASHTTIDLMDEIVRGMCVIHNGQILWGAKNLPVIEAKKPEEPKQTENPSNISITIDSKHVNKFLFNSLFNKFYRKHIYF